MVVIVMYCIVIFMIVNVMYYIYKFHGSECDVLACFSRQGMVMSLHVSYGKECAILNVSRGNECAFLTCCSWSRMCCTSIFLTVVSVPYLHTCCSGL
jgi:hypothetical protein